MSVQGEKTKTLSKPLSLADERGAIAIVGAITISAIALIMSNISFTKQSSNLSAMRLMKIGADIDSDHMSVYKKVDQYLSSKYLTRRNVCSGKTTLFKPSSYFKLYNDDKNINTGFKFDEGSKTFTVENCAVRRIKKQSNWNKLLTLTNAGSLPQFLCSQVKENYRVSIQDADCDPEDHSTTLSLEIKTDRTLKIGGKPRTFEKQSLARLKSPPCTEFKEQTITFESNKGKKNQCDLDLSKKGKSGKVVGKRIEPRKFSLASSEVSGPLLSCGFDFSSETDTFYYDDGFILSVVNAANVENSEHDDENSIMLVAGRMANMPSIEEEVTVEVPTLKEIIPEDLTLVKKDKASETEIKVKLEKFNYKNVEKKFYSGEQGCYGKTVPRDKDDDTGGCAVPKSEEPGKFVFNPSDETKLAIADLISPHKNGQSNEIFFRLMTFGDDNYDVDCQHSKLEFNMRFDFGVVAE